MNELNGFLILKNDGKIVFQHELYAQGSEDFDSALFSNVILAIQSFIQNLGEDNLRQMELGNSKVFISRDKEINLILVAKASKQAKAKKFNKFLKKIQEKLRNTYYEKIFSAKELIEYINTDFVQDFEEIVKDSFKQRLTDFFQSI
ncbi:MAG: roadblock/LC7 domain-containing protein [Candidatus Helarchaeota archaeon]